MSDIYARWAAQLGGGGSAASASASGGWAFGDVLAAGRGKLQVVCGGLTLGPDDLHLPPGLNYTWETDTGGDNLLRKGDRLLILVTADRQDYYVLQKAVFTA